MQKTEEHTASKTLGMFGGIDVRFRADIYPDVDNEPEKKHQGEIIIELKTGKQDNKHTHQTMCYLMTQFGLKMLNHFGFVLYSDKGNLKSFLLKVVEPNLKYFLDMVLHRNFYILNQKFYVEYQRYCDLECVNI
jgi:hypothetical protein